jgi:hypothetical protein
LEQGIANHKHHHHHKHHLQVPGKVPFSPTGRRPFGTVPPRTIFPKRRRPFGKKPENILAPKRTPSVWPKKKNFLLIAPFGTLPQRTGSFYGKWSFRESGWKPHTHTARAHKHYTHTHTAHARAPQTPSPPQSPALTPPPMPRHRTAFRDRMRREFATNPKAGSQTAREEEERP